MIWHFHFHRLPQSWGLFETWGPQGGGADANRFLEELMPVARTSTEKLTKLFEN